jgi:hypothetical protein
MSQATNKRCKLTASPNATGVREESLGNMAAFTAEGRVNGKN